MHPSLVDLEIVSEIAAHRIAYGEFESAMHLLELAQEIRPLSPEDRLALCRCYYACRQTERLAAVLSGIPSTDETEGVARLRALSAGLDGDFETAVKLFRAALRGESGNRVTG